MSYVVVPKIGTISTVTVWLLRLEQTMANARRRFWSEAGYNIIEMVFVVGIMGVLTGTAVLQIESSRPGLNSDGAMRVLIAQLNQARESAITQRRYMRLVFTAPNTIQIVREELDGTTTTLSSVLFEGGVTFSLVGGVPDTPDAFGNSAAIYFGSATNQKFGPDGTFVNQVGSMVNGSVFVSLLNQKRSVRAVTILGSTGRIQAYRFDGAVWKLA
jgi:type II secretory pathway pseudopilin PulG